MLARPIGLAGWLFQAAWVPQHVMAASCVVAAMLLLARYASGEAWRWLLTLALVVVAGFESSTFVGGVTFAVAALIAAPMLIAAAYDAGAAPAFAAGMAVAAVLVICLAAPFIRDQARHRCARAAAAVRLSFGHFAVLGEMFPHAMRRALDVPAYWLVLLPHRISGDLYRRRDGARRDAADAGAGAGKSSSL